MSEEEKKSDLLKRDLLEQQVLDVVDEFESLKILNQEYINTNERLNNEIRDLKELNEQQVILSDNILDSNKEIFKGSKRNIFWLVTILALAAILLSFTLIDKRIDSKISSEIKTAIKKSNHNLKTSSDSLALSKTLQMEIQKDTSNYQTIKKAQNQQIKLAQKEFQKILTNFKTTADGSNEAINSIKKDYETALRDFRIMLTKKETEIKDLKVKLEEEVAKTSKENTKPEVIKEPIAKEIKKPIVKEVKKPVEKVIKKATKKVVVKKQISQKEQNALLQKAFNYQKNFNYTNAIKAYNKLIEIDPKKDIAYYNLGIIYGNRKNYDLAIKAYNKSLELNPKRNLTFTNIFEIQLVTNRDFDSHTLKLYKDYNKNNKLSLIKYEMLDIFKDVKQHKNIDKKINNWKKVYAKTTLGTWSFDLLETWINKEKDKTTKDNLNLVLKTFKTHK